MTTALLEPALLFFDETDWRARAEHCRVRVTALAEHRRVSTTDGRRLGITVHTLARVFELFPWDLAGESGDVRDLREYLVSELERAAVLDSLEGVVVSVEPGTVLEKHVDDAGAIDAWHATLAAATVVPLEGDVVIATWPGLAEMPDAVDVLAGTSIASFLLTWSEERWAEVASEEGWPDVAAAVASYLQRNSSLRRHERARDEPFDLCAAPGVAAAVPKALRQRFLRACSKVVLGIHDEGLGYEEIGGVIRFRVTLFWRVHAEHVAGGVRLVEFGPHRIGGIG